jgi:hypothetical protein
VKSVQVKCFWDEVVDEVKSYEVVLSGFFIIIIRSDQKAMDGHYHHEQAR